MQQTVRSTCPLNCPDSCGLLVTVQDGRVTRIEGDPEHPLTRGFICPKGQKHIKQLYHPDRLEKPLVKSNGCWKSLDWDDALDLIAEKLYLARERYGPTSVLFHEGDGSSGLLRGMGRRFFNLFGGCSLPKGSLCWGSGYAAQQLDFGAVYAHTWKDILHSRLIVLWGRNPAETNVHMVPLLREARRRGAYIISVNPVRIRPEGIADLHLCPHPGSDGALALGMAHVIIREGLTDTAFVEHRVHGFAEFRDLVHDYAPENVEGLCGLPADLITSFARRYATQRPAAILFGYGLQRYANGGRTVRAIDGLAAITGNIGVPGGGANYCNDHWKGFFNDLSADGAAHQARYFPWPSLGSSILEADDPPVRCIFVTRSNPLTQLPDTKKARAAFAATDFVVAVDFFLNDTADAADLVLPCTTFLEDDDIVTCSNNEFIGLAPRVVLPRGEARCEVEIFTGLADRLRLQGFGHRTPLEWLAYALEPVAKDGITIERLREGVLRHPFTADVPWADGKFCTPSGKFELCASPYQPPYLRQEASDQLRYPLIWMTPHSLPFNHSQFWNLEPEERLFRPEVVYLHPCTAGSMGLAAGDAVLVDSPQGSIKAVVRLDERLHPEVALMHQGRWAKQGGGVNALTRETIPDLGLGTPYYDCRCRILPIEMREVGKYGL